MGKLSNCYLTFDDGMLGGALQAPYDDSGVEAPTSHQLVVWGPRHAVDACVVEAPLFVVSRLKYVKCIMMKRKRGVKQTP